MILELAVGTIVAIVFLNIGRGLEGLREKKVPSQPDDGSIAFNGGRYPVVDKDNLLNISRQAYGYKCPKCEVLSVPETYTPKFCECAEYECGHFHFECVCGFKAIMRTKS